jgi:hypothetical protein
MSVLSDEIDQDPTGKGYAAFLPDQPGAVVELLNAKTETVTGIIDRTNLTKWAAKTGMRLIVQQEADNQASPLCSSALSIIDVLRGSSGGIDLADPDNITLLNNWEASGKLPTESKNLMIALAAKKASRAEVLGLPYMTEELLRNR